MTGSRQQRLLSARCDELRRLGDGWDGPDSRAPSEDALRAVEAIVNGLELSPTADGEVAVWLAGRPRLVVDRFGAVRGP